MHAVIGIQIIDGRICVKEVSFHTPVSRYDGILDELVGRVYDSPNDITRDMKEIIVESGLALQLIRETLELPPLVILYHWVPVKMDEI